MKKQRKLNLKKLQIAKLNESNKIMGGTDTFPTTTPPIGLTNNCGGGSDPYTDETAGCSNQCPTTGPGSITIEILY
ncbi:hypothetical protein GTQ40_05865 [Flavobacteriaceae bacterium R38]|nr:hypothetical protein [Flavobacteriaceae bacterium R38]